MKDGPHTNSLEQAGLQGKLLPRSDSIFSIWHYRAKCVGDQHFPVSVGLDDVASRNTSQGKFQEIRVSIQVMINRWPGKLRCPDKRTPPADRRILTMPKTGDQETEGHLQGDVAREFNVSTQGDTLS